MPNQKISQDPNGVALVGAEQIPMVQGGQNVNTSPADILDYVESNLPASGIANVVEDTTPTLGGNLDADGYLISDLLNPVNPQDAATKDYVDDGLALKADDSHNHVAADVTDFEAAAKLATVADAINNGTTDVAPSQNAVFDALATKQPLDDQLTSVAALSYVGNAGKVVAVTAGADGFELVDAPSGGIAEVVEDTTPTLGGNLDADGNEIQNVLVLGIAAGGAISGAGGATRFGNNIDMDNFNVINVANPVNPQDAATKDYVDDQISGLPPASGGALEFLGSTIITFANNTTEAIVGTGLFTDTYDDYLIVGKKLMQDAGSGTLLYMRVKEDGAGAFSNAAVYDNDMNIADVSNNGFSIDYLDHTSNPQSVFIGPFAAQQMNGNETYTRVTQVGGTGNDIAASFRMWIHSARDATTFTNIDIEGVADNSGTGHFDVASVHKSNAKIEELRFYTDAGAIDLQGEFFVYGLRNS